MEAEWVKSETSDAENLAMTAVCHARSTRGLREAQHILLVEDETLVREVIYEVLQAAGFSVRKSRNAEEALDVQKGWDGTLQLLLTDVILPGSSGKEAGAATPEPLSQDENDLHVRIRQNRRSAGCRPRSKRLILVKTILGRGFDAKGGGESSGGAKIGSPGRVPIAEKCR